MWAGLRKVWEARNWMKKNEPFLSTWQAYVGYKLDLFVLLRTPQSFSDLVEKSGLKQDLLRCWVDTGLVLGHLKEDQAGLLSPSAQMATYFTRNHPMCIGELLKEMLEMHIPSLLQYPELLQGDSKKEYVGDVFGATVAATSALIQKRAYPYVSKIVRKHGITQILDIGCGTGEYLIDFAARTNSASGRYVGLDCNTTVIDQASQAARNKGLQQVEFTCMPFDEYKTEKPFDLAMLNNILHYFEPEQRANLLARAASHLGENGMIVIVTPLYLERFGRRFATAFNSFMQAHSNLHALPRRQELEEIANQNGFQLRHLKPIIREGSWYCLVFTKKGLS